MKRVLLAIAVAAFSLSQGHAADSSIRKAQVFRDGDTAMVTWEAVGGVDVLWSRDPQAAPGDMELLTAMDGDGMFALGGLDPGTRYYFYLRHRDGSGLRVAARLLPLEGGRNFRDLGGYRTSEGQTVKWGRVFRSGAMHELTDSDYDYLSDLGIQVVCDYRSAEERRREPTTWAAGEIDYFARDYASSDEGSRLMEALRTPGVTPEAMSEAMASTYFEILEQQKDAYSYMFHRLAGGDIPLAFNCSAGKDRAGTSAALVLAALGVSQEQIVHDYSLSELYVDYAASLLTAGADDAAEDAPYAFLSQLPPELLAPLLRSDPAYIRGTLRHLDERYGGVEAYLAEALGIDADELAAIRSQLLE